MEVRKGVCVRGCSAQTSQRGEDPPMYGMCEWQPAESAKRGVNGNQVNEHWVAVDRSRSTAIDTARHCHSQRMAMHRAGMDG